MTGPDAVVYNFRYPAMDSEFTHFQRLLLKHIKAEEERHEDPANILLIAVKRAIEEFLGANER